MLLLLLFGCPLVDDADLEPLRDLDGDGFVAVNKGGDDCNDDDADINPGVLERCDGVDQDCDGLIDEDDPDLVDGARIYDDVDGDGFGDPDTARVTCVVVGGANVVLEGGDCDDDDPSIHPNALELCDGIDQNCDEVIDARALSPDARRYADRDGDGFGDPERWENSCTVEPGWVLDASDCDDLDVLVNPGVPEVPGDGVDNDCDGGTDLDDLDGDGLADFPDGSGCNRVISTLWSVPGDFSQIASAVNSPRVLECDTIVVESGDYRDFVIDRPLRVVAADGAEVRIVAEPVDEVGVRVELDDGTTAVIDRLEIVGFPIGVEVVQGGLLASVDVHDGGMGVAVHAALLSSPSLDLVSSRLTHLTHAIEQVEGTMRLRAVHIEDVLGDTYVVSMGGFGAIADIRDLTVVGSAAGEGAIIGMISFGNLLIDGLLLEHNLGAAVEALTPDVVIRNAIIRHNVSTEPGFVNLAAPLLGNGELDRVLFEGNAWDPGEEPERIVGGLVEYLAIGTQAVRNVTFIDNDIPADKAHINVPLGSTVSVSHVAVVADAGIGVQSALSNATLEHLTLVGLDVGVSGALSEVVVRGSILAANRVAFAGLSALSVYDSAVVDNCADGVPPGVSENVVSAGPGFLRYHPDLPAVLIEPSLRTDSPLADFLDGCVESDGSACDLGAYSGLDRDPRRYQDVDGDGLYDRWECLAATDPACLCFTDDRYLCDASNFVGLDPDEDSDGDLLTARQEYVLGTLPHVADTDGDGLGDAGDPEPLEGAGDPRCALP